MWVCMRETETERELCEPADCGQELLTGIFMPSDPELGKREAGPGFVQKGMCLYHVMRPPSSGSFSLGNSPLWCRGPRDREHLPPGGFWQVEGRGQSRSQRVQDSFLLCPWPEGSSCCRQSDAKNTAAILFLVSHKRIFSQTTLVCKAGFV